MKRSVLWAALAASSLIPAIAHAAPWSRAFVVDWFEPAFLHDGPDHDNVAAGKDCPKASG